MTMWMTDDLDKHREIRKKHSIPDAGNMKKSIFAILVIHFWAVYSYTAQISYYSLYVTIPYTNRLVELNLFPSGQFYDPNRQYSMQSVDPYKVVCSYNQTKIYVGGGGINRFFRNPDGTLTLMSITTTLNYVFDLEITPDDQLLLALSAESTGDTKIYSITTTGGLIDTGNTYWAPFFSPVDPLGKLCISRSSSGESLVVYHIDYGTKTVNVFETITTGAYGMSGARYTPDGKLVFVYGTGVDSSNNTVAAFTIDATGSLSTTWQAFSHFGGGCDDLAVSQDNRYAWATFGTTVAILEIDPTTHYVTDTGRRVSLPQGRPVAFLRTTPDGQMIVASYSASGGKLWFASGWIQPSGNIQWTGYTFAIDSIYGNSGTTVTDYVLVPVYTTSIPPELWGKLE